MESQGIPCFAPSKRTPTPMILALSLKACLLQEIRRLLPNVLWCLLNLISFAALWKSYFSLGPSISLMCWGGFLLDFACVVVDLCVNVNVHVSVYMCECMYKYVCLCMSLCMCLCEYVWVCVYVSVGGICVWKSMWVCMSVACVCACVWECVYMSVWACMYMCDSVCKCVSVCMCV